MSEAAGADSSATTATPPDSRLPPTEQRRLHAAEEKEEKDDEEADEGQREQERILEEYRIWKKNAPFLYDCVLTHALEWPSLTVEWLPDRALPSGKEYSVQRLILGTHTSVPEEGQEGKEGNAAPPVDLQNYLMIAEVRLPHGDGGVKNSGSASNKKSGRSGSAMDVDDGDIEDEDEDEEGAYGAASGKVQIVQYMSHLGDVNRARHAPHNPNLIATKTDSSRVFVFDRTRHPCKPMEDAKHICKPDTILAGHEAEGYAIAWNPHQHAAGQLVSGSNDRLICLWDVESGSREAKKKSSVGEIGQSNLVSLPPIQPLSTFKHHTDVVEDVAWSPFQSTLFASCGDDVRLLLWDTRTTKKPAHIINERSMGREGTGHHTANINACTFNLFSEFMLASAGEDCVVNLWDIRRLHSPLHALTGAKDAIFNVSFSPFSGDVIAAASADRRAYVWDMSRIGEEVARNEADDDDEEDNAPPELLFVHGGHTDKIGDLSWNPNAGEEWMLASVADDNILQIWQIAENIHADDEAEDAQPSGASGRITVDGREVEEIE